MNILIIGGGFIGKGLAVSFKEIHGFSVFVKTRMGELPDVDINLIIDCTSQKSKKECESFTVELAEIFKIFPDAKGVSLQSFSTLQTQPQSSELHNFGSKIIMHTPYSAVKEYKELCLLRDESLREKIHFAYLPVVLGEGGIWCHHSSALKAKGRFVNIPDCKVDWVTINFICEEIIRLQRTRGRQRLIASEGVSYLDELMALDKAVRTHYWYNQYFDAFSFGMLKLFSRYPFFINASFKAIELLFGQVSLYFPSVFYWFLFRVQSGFNRI